MPSPTKTDELPGGRRRNAQRHPATARHYVELAALRPGQASRSLVALGERAQIVQMLGSLLGNALKQFVR